MEQAFADISVLARRVGSPIASPQEPGCAVLRRWRSELRGAARGVGTESGAGGAWQSRALAKTRLEE